MGNTFKGKEVITVDLVKVSYGTVINTLRSLEAKKIVVKQGAGRDTKYALTISLR